MAVGEVASSLGIAPNTLSFHFDRLRHAGLVSVVRHDRSLIYAARYETMNGLLAYLTENCCQGDSSACGVSLRHPAAISEGVARHGRSLIYAARYDTMTNLLGYLMENCCGGRPELCAPTPCKPITPP